MELEERDELTVAFPVKATYKTLFDLNFRNLYTKAIFAYILFSFYLAYAQPFFVLPVHYIIRVVIYVILLMVLSVAAIVITTYIQLPSKRKEDMMLTLKEEEIILFYLRSEVTELKQWFFVTKAIFTKKYLYLETLNAPSYIITIPRKEFVEDNLETTLTLLKLNDIPIIRRDLKKA